MMGQRRRRISSNNVVLNGVVGGDAANVKLVDQRYTVRALPARTWARNIVVTVSGLTLTGASATNYTLSAAGRA